MNPHGTPIWYELITPDPDAAKTFYDFVVGWSVEAQPSGPMDYRMISAGDGLVGGVMRLTDEMRAGGGQPGWLFYVGVDDVDATAARVTELGGAILMPPFDIPGVGRVASVTDPQGCPFYIMRGASEESSTVFGEGIRGRCGWHELWTSDAAGAIVFFAALFGWENRETMDMGPMGNYHFLDLGPTRLGALAQATNPGQPTRWTFYFNVESVDTAAERIAAGGGTVVMGPHDIPGGGRIVIAADPHGAGFALLSGREGARP